MHAKKTYQPTPFLYFLSGGVLFLQWGGCNDGPLCLLLGLRSAAPDNRLGDGRHTHSNSTVNKRGKDEAASQSNY